MFVSLQTRTKNLAESQTEFINPRNLSSEVSNAQIIFINPAQSVPVISSMYVRNMNQSCLVTEHAKMATCLCQFELRLKEIFHRLERLLEF